jgi:hypothetical protein
MAGQFPIGVYPDLALIWVIPNFNGMVQVWTLHFLLSTSISVDW